MVSDTVLTADVGVGVGVAAAVSKDDGSAVGIDDGIRQRQRAPCAVRERAPSPHKLRREIRWKYSTRRR